MPIEWNTGLVGRAVGALAAAALFLGCPTEDPGPPSLNPSVRYFETSLRFAAGDDPIAVASADLNRDTDPDLVVANLLSDSVGVYLADPDTTFADAVFYATGANPSAVAVADFDGNDVPDILVANRGSADLSYLRGAGGGRFEEQARFSLDSAGPADLVVADFNDDGNLDAATANEPAGTVSVVLGTGDGAFGPADPLTVAVRRRYAEILKRRERYEQAEAALLTSLDALHETLGETHERTKGAARELAALYEAWGRPEQAAALRGEGDA